MRVAKSFSALLLLCLLLVACGNSSEAAKSQTVAQTKATSVPDSARPFSPLPESKMMAVPTHLTIPAIHVDAGVEPVGIENDGTLGTPTRNIWENAGWYEYGTRPGDNGSAVLDGHLDRVGGDPAVFWNLGNLHPGDRIDITNAKGQLLHFVVTRIGSYTTQQAPLAAIFNNTTGRYLNLITCAGDWIPSQHSYSIRLVVFTKEV